MDNNLLDYLNKENLLSETSEDSLVQIKRLDDLEQIAWQSGQDYLKWPGIELQKALGAWDEGILFLSAQENLGKTSFLIQAVVKLLDKNKDLCVLDISLDDSFRERTRRYAGCISGVDTHKVARPLGSTEEERRKREEAYKTLSRYMANGQLEIRTHAEDDCAYYFKIEELIRHFCESRKDKKIVVIVDSWHDIILPENKGEEPEKIALLKISKALKDHKAISIMTAHRRKSSTSEFTRRSSNDELKGSAYIKHFAKVMMTLHNEVKIRRDNAQIFWVDPLNKEKKMPVLELSVQKNKCCDYDGFIFYRFEPSTGRSKEVSVEEADYYKNIAYESLKFNGIRR